MEIVQYGDDSILLEEGRIVDVVLSLATILATENTIHNQIRYDTDHRQMVQRDQIPQSAQPRAYAATEAHFDLCAQAPAE